jgi:integrase/recombinase XerD
MASMTSIARQIDEYLAFRLGAGYALESQTRTLRAFARYCARTRRAVITARVAIRWAGLAAAPISRIRRLRAIRDFVLHARAADDCRHEVPPDHFGHERSRRPTPYILSSEEIRRLLRGARGIRSSFGVQSRVIEVLFGLLAATGIRIGEALSLRCDDITRYGLSIRHSKSGRGRLLPLHETTSAALDDFLRWRRRVPTTCDRLFITEGGTPLKHDNAYQWFRRIIAFEGIGIHRGNRRLYLHSLRHTFAVRALELGTRRRQELGLHMKAVSQYLGHVNLACTYWYYEATPELLADVLKDCERYATT